jgi:hypothetical protein
VHTAYIPATLPEKLSSDVATGLPAHVPRYITVSLVARFSGLMKGSKKLASPVSNPREPVRAQDFVNVADDMNFQITWHSSNGGGLAGQDHFWFPYPFGDRHASWYVPENLCDRGRQHKLPFGLQTAKKVANPIQNVGLYSCLINYKSRIEFTERESAANAGDSWKMLNSSAATDRSTNHRIYEI